MKLRELTEELDQSDKNEIISFFEDNQIDPHEYKIRDDGRVDVFDDCIIVNLIDGNIPVKFGKISGMLSISGENITSFGDWVPEEANWISLDSNKLSSFEGLSGKQKIDSWFLDKNEFTDLHNIHKYIPKATKISIASNDITKNILGICLIEGMTSINQINRDFATNILKDIRRETIGKESKFVDNNGEIFDDIDVAFWVVAKYLNQGKSGMIKAQREMIDLDLDDFAQI